MKSEPFASLVAEHIAATPVRENLRSRGAVVLQRIARGAGQTDWFYCGGVADLDRVIGRLRPGSKVSFYFNEQIRRCRYSEQTRMEIENVIAATGECVVGALGDDGITMERDFVCSTEELVEFVDEHSTSEWWFYGAFPGWDNDGRDAVTLTLPDRDGVVRDHPI